MQALRLLIAVFSVAVLGGAADTRAADLGTMNVVPADQIKKKIAPVTTAPASPNAGKTVNMSPGNEQALRNAAQPNVPASDASSANIPQTAVQPQQLPEADLSGMRRTDGSSPPAGAFGSINDHRPPIYPDARETLNTSPRNEQILRDASRPDFPQGAVPGLTLPDTPSTVPGGSAGTTSRENKGTAGGTSGLNNASALGNANAPGLNQGAAGIGGRNLLENELKQGNLKVLDPEVAKTLEEIRPLEEMKVKDPLSGADPNADPWKQPLSPTPNTEPGSAAAKAGLIEGPQEKASDRSDGGNEIGPSPPQPNEIVVDHPNGRTVEYRRNSDGSSTRVEYYPDATSVVYSHDPQGHHVRTDTSDGRNFGPDNDQDYIGAFDRDGIPMPRHVVEFIGAGKTPLTQHSERGSGSSTSTQPNENEPQYVGWRGLAPARPAKATNQPRGPLVSPVDPDDAVVRIQEEGRRSTAEIKAMVTQPGEGSKSGGSDGDGKRDPCRFARPGPDGQLPPECTGGGGGPR